MEISAGLATLILLSSAPRSNCFGGLLSTADCGALLTLYEGDVASGSLGAAADGAGASGSCAGGGTTTCGTAGALSCCNSSGDSGEAVGSETAGAATGASMIRTDRVLSSPS